MTSPEPFQQQLAKGKPYVVVFLTKGKNFILDKEEAEAMRAKHFKHVFELRAQGKVSVMFGTRENGFIRSIEVFNSSDKAEVERLVAQDPGVQAGHFAYEVHLMTGLPGDKVE